MNTQNLNRPTTLAQVNGLDDALVIAGYKDGRKGTPNQTQTDAAYWHGYGNGLVDSGRAPADHIQTQIAGEFNAAMRQQATSLAQ